MWSRIDGSTSARRVARATSTLDLIGASRPRRPRRPPASRCARGRAACGRTSTASASSRERSSSCSTSDAMRARLLLERDRGARACCSSASRSPRWLSVWTKPWIVVTGVRSSCAASATKFVITSFARSSASRDSCSCSKRRTRSSAMPVSAATVCSTRSSSVAEERRVRRRPDDEGRAAGVARRRTGSPEPLVGRVADGASCEHLAVGVEDRRARRRRRAPRPGPSTRSATSCRVVASVIRPRIASCRRCCSGARQDARTMPRRRDPERGTQSARAGARALRSSAATTESWLFGERRPDDRDRQRAPTRTRAAACARSRRRAVRGPRATAAR